MSFYILARSDHLVNTQQGPLEEIQPWQVLVYIPHQKQTNGTQLPQATNQKKVNLHSGQWGPLIQQATLKKQQSYIQSF